jgi:hypothetical protein
MVQEGVRRDFKRQLIAILSPNSSKNFSEGATFRAGRSAKGGEIPYTDQLSGRMLKQFNVRDRPDPPGIAFPEWVPGRITEDPIPITAAEGIKAGMKI